MRGMRGDVRRHWATVPLLSMVGCGSAATPERGLPACWQEAASAAPAARPWGFLGEPGLAPDGLSVALTIPAPDGSDVLTLRASDPAGAPVCVQLASLLPAAGGAWVTAGAGDYGPYCTSCAQRVSVGIGYGLFIVPSNEQALQFPTTLEAIFGLRDCATLLPVGPPGPGGLYVEGLFGAAVEPTRSGVISLGLAFLGASPLADETKRAAVIPETLRQLNALLAPGALQVQVVRTRTLASERGALELTRGDNRPLDALYRALTGDGGACSAPKEDGWVPVVFAGCIRIVDPLQQTTSEPDAMTPGIPDGFPPTGRAQGIYLKGQSCRAGTTPATAAIDWPPSLLATLLAHELGHYLGLYHSIEADGTMDQLADTDDQNLMYYSPLTVSDPTFSASQFRVMRRHPAISWNSR